MVYSRTQQSVSLVSSVQFYCYSIFKSYHAELAAVHVVSVQRNLVILYKTDYSKVEQRIQIYCRFTDGVGAGCGIGLHNIKLLLQFD